MQEKMLHHLSPLLCITLDQSHVSQQNSSKKINTIRLKLESSLAQSDLPPHQCSHQCSHLLNRIRLMCQNERDNDLLMLTC